MPITVNQFDQVAIGTLEGSVTFPSKSCQVVISSNQRKRLTGISASLTADSSTATGAFKNTFGRIVVCTGSLALDSNGVINSDPTYYFPGQTLTGAQRLIMSVPFINSINLDFSFPVEIMEDETLNVVLGRGNLDGSLSVVALVGSLSVKGILGNEAKFPYSLR